MEKTLKNDFNEETYLEAKKIGYTDKVIEKITGKKMKSLFMLYLKWLIPVRLSLRL